MKTFCVMENSAAMKRDDGGASTALDSVTKLEFPDWSGMKQRHFPVSFAEAVAFNEEMNRLFPAPAEAHRLRLERKILVPFEL